MSGPQRRYTMPRHPRMESIAALVVNESDTIAARDQRSADALTTNEDMNGVPTPRNDGTAEAASDCDGAGLVVGSRCRGRRHDDVVFRQTLHERW